MTRLIGDRDLQAVVMGLSNAQAYMAEDLTKNINGMVEMDRMTAAQALEVLNRLAAIIRKKVLP